MNNRRSFLKNIGNLVALAAMPFGAAQAANNRIIVVGGGVAGTRVAAYLKISLPSATVMLFDSALKNFSGNKYIAIQNNYKPVSKEVLDEIGIDVIAEIITQLNPVEKVVHLANGKSYKADLLVVAPGVDFKWGDLNGYKLGMEQNILHAWQHPSNELVLWKQIESMKNGDNIVISIPQAPYRFTQGPYQRATRIASYLKKSKPGSKILVLDSNNEFPSMQSYLELWENKFPNMVEWISASNGGVLEKVDLQRNLVYAGGEIIKSAVLNVIPPQQAGVVARQAGLNLNSDWCQVNSDTLESIHYKHVYVIGDANNVDINNKTASSAEHQALQCVTSIKALIS